MTTTGPGLVGSGPTGAGPARVCRFADLVALVVARPARLGAVRLVAVDGAAGSGKSTFAGRLAAAVRAGGAVAAEVHTDDLLDGWADLLAFWPRLESGILEPLAAGRPGGYHGYDWEAGRLRADPTAVPVPEILIVEGVASSLAAVRDRLTLAVRVLAPDDLRLARGMARDGVALLPQWLRWQRAEAEHFAGAAPGPDDVLVDGAPTLPHDADREYVEAGGPLTEG